MAHGARGTGEAADRLEQVESPAGPLLAVARGAPTGPTLYAMVDGRWRYLYQAAWMLALADKAPAGTCLGGGFYLGRWPWPKRLLPVLSRLGLDPATLAVDGAYYADEAKVALVHATVGVQGNELVLRTADLRVLVPASLWSRLFNRCTGAPL